MASDQEYRRLAKRLAGQDRRLKAVERSAQSGFRSVEDGTFDVHDADGELVQTFGIQPDGTVGVIDYVQAVPPAPSTPGVVAGIESLSVAWDGALTADLPGGVSVAKVAVHVSQDAGFVADAGTEVATLPSSGGMLLLPADTEVETYVRLVTVSAAGVMSEGTPEVMVIPRRPPAAGGGPTTDGEPPTTPPVFTLVAGVVDTVFVKVDAYTNPDPVEFRVYLSAVSGFAPDPTNLYVQNKATLSTAVGLTAGTPYYFRLSAIDADGEGPISAQQTATPIRIDPADLAQSIVDSIDAAGATADAAQIDADQALADALASLGVANTAQTSADTADGKAVAAQTDADTGIANAATAQTAASTADGKAVAAQTDADSAQTAANTADGKAVTAQTAANTADGKAVAAQADADTAQTAASTADSKAVTADGKAVTAQTAANTAQTAANTAQTTANSKGEVLIQSTTPITADRLAQNLWIDTTNNANTPKTWTGSAWVARTDKAATDAAAAAVAAKTAADAARAAASTAQTTADGKNSITHSGTSPTGVGPLDDTWFKYANGVVTGMWRGSGTAWVSQKIDGLTLANIDAASITVGFLNVALLIKAGAISATKIAANSITADQIAVGAITANAILAGAIDGMIITGSTIRTAASGQRIVIDTAGLEAYNAAGTTVTTIDSATGQLSATDASLNGVFKSVSPLGVEMVVVEDGYIHFATKTATPEEIAYSPQIGFDFDGGSGLGIMTNTSGGVDVPINMIASGRLSLSGKPLSMLSYTEASLTALSGGITVEAYSDIVLRSNYGSVTIEGPVKADSMRPVAKISGSTTITTGVAYIPLTGGSGVVFTAPPSGTVLVNLAMTSKTATAGLPVLCGFEIRAGASIGSGAVFLAAHYVVSNGANTYSTNGGAELVTGLTPGASYNARAMFASNTAGTSVNAANGNLIVSPSL